MKLRNTLLQILSLLVLVTLACGQSTGEIISAEEATRRALPPTPIPIPTRDINREISDIPQPGDEVTLKGPTMLINLLDAPDGGIFSGASRGETVTVLEVTQVEGKAWYQVNSTGGQGWVSEDFIEFTPPTLGPQPGDEVYLVGKAFIVNILESPGGEIYTIQNRGERVTILEASEYEGATWYRIDAPAGQGWVASENISTEAPK